MKSLISNYYCIEHINVAWKIHTHIIICIRQNTEKTDIESNLYIQKSTSRERMY